MGEHVKQSPALQGEQFRSTPGQGGEETRLRGLKGEGHCQFDLQKICVM